MDSSTRMADYKRKERSRSRPSRNCWASDEENDASEQEHRQAKGGPKATSERYFKIPKIKNEAHTWGSDVENDENDQQQQEEYNNNLDLKGRKAPLDRYFRTPKVRNGAQSPNPSTTSSTDSADEIIRRKTMEKDPKVLARRQKQIDYGKNTEEYKEYLEFIPREKRVKRLHPETPKKVYKYSRRSWDKLIRNWRRNLHHWWSAEGALDCLDLEAQLELRKKLRRRKSREDSDDDDEMKDIDMEDLTPEMKELLNKITFE